MQNEAIGVKTVWVGPKVMIDGEDAETLKEGENATFIGWGNLLIKKLIRCVVICGTCAIVDEVKF